MTGKGFRVFADLKLLAGRAEEMLSVFVVNEFEQGLMPAKRAGLCAGLVHVAPFELSSEITLKALQASPVDAHRSRRHTPSEHE